MPQEYHVSGFTEYVSICEQLAKQGNTYFRGQVVDYPQVLPSLFRPGAVSNPDFEEMISALYISCYAIGNWQEMWQERLDEFARSFPGPVGVLPDFLPGGVTYDWEFPEPDRLYGLSFFNYDPRQYIDEIRDSFVKNWNRHSDALLQHYGVPSRALDITDDPLVALWFATNSFRRNPDGTAVFVSADGANRVVYVFQNPQQTVISLQTVGSGADFGFEGMPEIPYFGLRGIAQKGLLLFGATAANPDLRYEVSAIIRLGPGPWSNDALTSRGYDYRHMIPLGNADPFYAALLKERAMAKSRFHEVVQHIIEYV